MRRPVEPAFAMLLVAASCFAGCDDEPEGEGEEQPEGEDEGQPESEAPPSPWQGYRRAGTFGGRGVEPGQLHTPMGVDADAEGRIWIADTGNQRVQVLDREGEHVMSFPADGADAEVELRRPIDVAVAGDGTAWVTDFQADRLLRIDLKGKVHERRELPDGTAPAGVAALADGGVAVAGFYAHRILLFDGGEAHETLGEKGHGRGELYYPTDVEALGDGARLIADAYNHRIVHLTAGGEFERSYEGPKKASLRVPSGVAVEEGVLHIADSENRRVVALARDDGRLLAEHRIEPPVHDAMYSPVRLAARDRRVYVADPAGARILVLEEARGGQD